MTTGYHTKYWKNVKESAEKLWSKLKQSYIAFNFDQEFSDHPFTFCSDYGELELIPVIVMDTNHCFAHRNLKISQKNRDLLKSYILDALTDRGIDIDKLYLIGKKELHAEGIRSFKTDNIKEYCAFFTLMNCLNDNDIAQVSAFWGESFSFSNGLSGKEFISSYFNTLMRGEETAHFVVDKRTGEKNLISFRSDMAPCDIWTIGEGAYLLPNASDFISWSNSLVGNEVQVLIDCYSESSQSKWMDGLVADIRRFLTYLNTSDCSFSRKSLFSPDYFDKSLGLAKLRAVSVAEAAIYHEDLSDDFHGYHHYEYWPILAIPLFSNKGWNTAEYLFNQRHASYGGGCMMIVKNKEAAFSKEIGALIPSKTKDDRKDIIDFCKVFTSPRFRTVSYNDTISRDLIQIASRIFPVLNAFLATDAEFDERDLSCRTCVKLQLSADTNLIGAFSKFFLSTLKYALGQTPESRNLNSKFFKTWVNYFSLLSQKTEEERNQEYCFLEDLDQMIHASDSYAYTFFYEAVVEGNIPYIKSIMAKLPTVVAAFNKLICYYSPIQLDHCPSEFVSPCGTITFRREKEWEVYQKAAVFINQTYGNGLCVANGTYSHGFNTEHVGYIGTSIVDEKETIVSILIANNSGVLDYGYWERNRSDKDAFFTSNYSEKVQDEMQKKGVDSNIESRLPEGVDFQGATEAIRQLYQYIGTGKPQFYRYSRLVFQELPLNTSSVKKNLNKNLNWWYENLHASFLILSRPW